MERSITLIVDEDDFRAINAAIARRQSWRIMPDGGGGNLTGRVIAEICRGWMERLDADEGDNDSNGEGRKDGA